jgi:hypothetical protein
MSTWRSDLEKICNYVESDKPSFPTGNIFYMDNISSHDEWVINQHKRINRQKILNEVLDEQEEIVEDTWLPKSDGEMSVMTPRMMSMSVKSKKFNSYDDLYDDIISHLESITSSSMKTLSEFGKSGSLNIQKSNDSFLSNSENDDATLRRIITKLTFCNNLISMMSMMGPANTVIVGDEIFYYLMSANNIISKDDDNMFFIMNLNLVRSSKIKKNKCIVLKTSGQLGCGVCVSKHNDGRYFLKETPNYEKTIVWFELN